MSWDQDCYDDTYEELKDDGYEADQAEEIALSN